MRISVENNFKFMQKALEAGIAAPVVNSYRTENFAQKGGFSLLSQI